MAQAQAKSWTNPNPAVARTESVGFQIDKIKTIDVTNGGSWEWVRGMPNGSYLDVDAGTITLSNGFTPVAQNALYGAVISGITNANPAVISAAHIDQSGIAVGDTIKVTGVADDGSGTTLNADYTVASVTATTITTATDTSSGFSVYVSGGTASRVSDVNGDPVPTDNFSVEGVTIGTGVVGANSAAMVAYIEGSNSVT